MATRSYRRKTDPDERRGRPPKPDSEVTSELLASGEATIAQLGQMFETDPKTLPKRMKRCLSRGIRRGYKTYNIREAASFIVTPGYEIEEFIRQMSPQELPNLLQKEFWNGQRARLEYETKLGQHWPTEQVVEFVGELLNVVRMSLLLVADDVNREQSLTDGQRKVFQRITDGAISTMAKSVEEKFAAYHANRTDLGSTNEPDADDDGGNILAAEDEEEDDLGI